GGGGAGLAGGTRGPVGAGRCPAGGGGGGGGKMGPPLVGRRWEPRGDPGRSPGRVGGRPMGAAIEVDGLVKRYRRKLAVDGVSLSVGEGEAFGYVGPNGAGKTTTIRCLLGLIRPTGGVIRVLGRDVAGAPRA